jgi:hypothetical protein
MVAATVLLTALAVLGPTLTSMIRNTNRITNEAGALDDARRALRQIERDVRSSACIAAPAVSTNGTSLVLMSRTGVGGVVPITYAVSGTTLTRAVTVAGVSTPVVVLRDLHTATNRFTRMADGRVTVDLTVAVDHGRADRSVGATLAARSPEATCPD